MRRTVFSSQASDSMRDGVAKVRAQLCGWWPPCPSPVSDSGMKPYSCDYSQIYEWGGGSSRCFAKGSTWFRSASF